MNDARHFLMKIAEAAACALLASVLAIALVPFAAFADTADDDSQGLAENSWRYENGLLKDESEMGCETSSMTLLADGDDYELVDNPWTWQGSGFINQIGDIIPNARLKGIDISEHQGMIDWDAVASSDVDYVIIRCGYGNDLTYQDDDYWVRNVTECARRGIPFGVYLYSYATNTEMARSEAQHVLRLLDEVGYTPTYPVYLDLEDASILRAGIGTEGLGDIAEVFCSTLENAGYMAGVYANLNWWNNYLTDARFSRWERWVAQYNITCDYTGYHTMWQCTSSGTVPGIAGSVDIDFDLVHRSRTYGMYVDVPSDAWVVTEGWFDYVTRNGLMSGDRDAAGNETGYFRPDDQLTRGQFATILYRYACPDATDTDFDYAADETGFFVDNASNVYYTAAINWAYRNGIMTGYKHPETGELTGYVGPDDPVSRQDVATMLARYADALGVNTSASTGFLETMPDAAEVYDYALEAIAWCQECGIMTGEPVNGATYLNPRENATRAEMAKMIAAFAKTMDGKLS